MSRHVCPVCGLEHDSPAPTKTKIKDAKARQLIPSCWYLGEYRQAGEVMRKVWADYKSRGFLIAEPDPDNRLEYFTTGPKLPLRGKKWTFVPSSRALPSPYAEIQQALLAGKIEIPESGSQAKRNSGHVLAPYKPYFERQGSRWSAHIPVGRFTLSVLTDRDRSPLTSPLYEVAVLDARGKFITPASIFGDDPWDVVIKLKPAEVAEAIQKLKKLRG